MATTDKEPAAASHAPPAPEEKYDDEEYYEDDEEDYYDDEEEYYDEEGVRACRWPPPPSRAHRPVFPTATARAAVQLRELPH